MDFNRGLPVTGPVRAQMEGQSRNNPAVVMSPQPSTSNLAVLAQPQISEGVCEHSVYIWELKESTFPAAVVPNERILDPIREPSRDTSSSIFDFHRLLDSGVFIRGQEVQKPAEWKLQLGMKQAPNNQTDQELQITLVCMKCYIPDAVPIWTKFSFEIIDEDGQALYTTGCIYDAELRHFLPGMSSSISLGTKTELQAKRDEYILDGSLRFRLRLNIYQELLVAAAPADNERELYIPASKRSRQELPSLLGTLEDLWNSRETSGDITIRCGDQNIKVHKFILSARSKVFAGMFDKETKELQTNIIEVEDASLDDMLYLLEFMYLGDLNRFEWTSVDQICTLVYVADKYWIVPLMIKCFQNLMKLMDLENFGKIARVTFIYDCEKEFKDEVRHFYESHQVTLNAVASFRNFAHEHFSEFYKLFFYQIN